MATAREMFTQYDKWFRLTILIDFGGRKLCHDVLFNRERLPTDGRLLYLELVRIESRIGKFAHQREVLFPTSQITDFRKFDVTLYTSIILGLFGNKYKSLASDLRNARNREFHRGNKDLSESEFGLLWVETTDMLQKHGFDVTSVDNLKTSNIIPLHDYMDNVSWICQGTVCGFRSYHAYSKFYPIRESNIFLQMFVKR